MPPQYLLPCDNCDHQLEVVPKQAGQDLQCPQCQHVSEVPMLGKMRELELVGGTLPTEQITVKGGSLKNLMFVAGLAIAMISGLAGGALYIYANQMIYQVDSETQSQQFDQDVDSLKPSELVELYQIMQIDGGLGEWYEPNYIRYNKQGAILVNVSYGLLGLAGTGLLVMLGSFCMKK